MRGWKDKLWTEDKRQRTKVLAAGVAVLLGLALLVAWGFWNLTKPSLQARQLHAERQAFVKAAAKQHDFDVWWRKASDAEDARIGIMPYVTSLCFDSHGYGWVGTEDKGIFRIDPALLNDNTFAHYTTQDGLGDNYVYALACDKQGRIWAGHLNHGVSVFNGKNWRNYGPLDGPLGERVYSIKVCPTDGDVWIATDAGLTRYSDSQGTWTNYTTAQGLPTNEVQALAFDPKGRLYVGTQCDGIVIASPEDNYQNWTLVRGPAEEPLVPAGGGLPSGMINDLLVAKDGTVYAATDAGLAWSKDRGQSWKFARGKDWVDKVRGRLDGPPKNWQEHTGAWLSEDYVTCLAQDGGGWLWLGYRMKGYEAWDMDKMERRAMYVGTDTDHYVASMAAGPAKSVWVGFYQLGLRGAAQASEIAATPMTSYPPLPAAKQPPNLAELNQWIATVASIPRATDDGHPAVVTLTDDWRTRGDWLGRYGREWACLSAMVSPKDFVWAPGPDPVEYGACVDPRSHDALRYFVQWLYTDNPCSLEMPAVYLDSRIRKGLTKPPKVRREAEWDDHGEAGPMTRQGPDVYCTVRVPKGWHQLSFYEFNKDGRSWFNRIRDFRVSIRPHPGDKPLRDIDDFVQEPELANARVRDFWGGVYKRFLVHGPADYTIQVEKNHSFDALLTAVFLDAEDEYPAPYFQSRAQWEQFCAKRASDAAKPYLADTTLASNEPAAVNRLFNDLEAAAVRNSAAWAALGTEPYQSILRWRRQAEQTGIDEPDTALRRQVATCYYRTGAYPKWEALQKSLGLTPAREQEHRLRWDGMTDSYRGKEFDLLRAGLAGGGALGCAAKLSTPNTHMGRTGIASRIQ